MAVGFFPKVQSFPADAAVEDVVAALKVAGGCIIRDYVSEEDLNEIQKDLRPHLEADVPWTGEFFPPETRRAYGIVGKSFKVATCLPMSTLYRQVCKDFLEEHYTSWSGSKQEVGVSKPQLNNSIAFSIRPGASAQPLHRDDHCHMVRNETVSVYPENPGQARRDNLVGLFVAGKATTQANGATRSVVRNLAGGSLRSQS
jgi:ectoine hydroxylase-related dioxygenase (phytanoyl-CoA dioxygenase family)